MSVQPHIRRSIYTVNQLPAGCVLRSRGGGRGVVLIYIIYRAETDNGIVAMQ